MYFVSILLKIVRMNLLTNTLKHENVPYFYDVTRISSTILHASKEDVNILTSEKHQIYTYLPIIIKYICLPILGDIFYN